MRNLKKILAMVLALVMSLSLMATAGAADFTDASSINEKYETAIEVLEGLGVFKGYQDGTFQPQGSITRAETAAIIYRIVTGDVKDEQVGIYADYNLFTDVPSTSWFAGYVNYCANAEYIKGVGGGKFNPNAQVTGYAALAMILRAIGYTANGGFTGSDWEVQTARTAEARKITKNIMTGTLGQNANRETVAEILFQAILVNMVDHNILNTNNGNQGYTEIDETLGYKTFKLEELEGVVVANEFADLYSASVLANGRTNFEVAKDDIRGLDISTEITDIGMRQLAYIAGSRVLSMDDTGLNKVTETGDAVEIDTAAKFSATADMSYVGTGADATQFFVNFGRTGNVTCDQRLEFQVTFQNATAETSFDNYAGVNISAVAAADNNDTNRDNNWTVTGASLNADRTDYVADNWATTPVTYHKIIRADIDISENDLAVLYGIFGAADNNPGLGNNGQLWDQIDGDVFVGTVSTSPATRDEQDLSNKISYNKFVADYLNPETYDVNWNTSVNGDWVKFIDNDLDGNADYAFVTHSWLDEATGTYTNRSGDTITEYYRFNEESSTVRYMDGNTPAVGDVVVCALIDGQILVEPAKNETVTVSNYDWRADKITTDKGEYGQSGIGNWTEMQQLIRNMEDRTEYIVHFDHFGFVRAYELPGGTQYALLTEIYASNNATGNVIQNWPMTVELKAGEAEIAEYGLAGGGNNIFVARTPWTEVISVIGTQRYYNWLQPAIAHLGVTRTNPAGLTAVKGDPSFSGNWQFWPDWNQYVKIVSPAPATNVTALNEFNYGIYDRTKIPVEQTTANTYSFTNVAIANINGDTATLSGAAQLRLDNAGNPTWFDTNGNGIWDAGERARYAVDYVQLGTGNVAAQQVNYPVHANYSGYTNGVVNATHNTEFYIVHNDGVEYFKDYVNMPALNGDNYIYAAYAVARDTSADSATQPYWVADVIVYEVRTWNDNTRTSVALAYFGQSRTTGEVQMIKTLSNVAGGPMVDLVPTNLNWNAQGGTFHDFSGYGFYQVWNGSEVADGQMTARRITRIPETNRTYASYGIYAGTVDRVAEDAVNGGYIYVNVVDNTGRVVRSVALAVNSNVYAIRNDNELGGGNYNEAVDLRYSNLSTNQVQPGDQIIWQGGTWNTNTVCSSAYIVDLGNSAAAAGTMVRDRWDATPTFLKVTEWGAITTEQGTPSTSDTIDITFKFTSATTGFPGHNDVTVSVPKGTAVTYDLNNALFTIESWNASTVVVKDADNGNVLTGSGTDYTWTGAPTATLALNAATTDEDLTVEVTYVKASYTLTVTTATMGTGTSTITVNGSAFTSGNTVNVGDMYVVTVTPDADYSYTYTVNGGASTALPAGNQIIGTIGGANVTIAITGNNDAQDAEDERVSEDVKVEGADPGTDPTTGVSYQTAYEAAGFTVGGTGHNATVSVDAKKLQSFIDTYNVLNNGLFNTLRPNTTGTLLAAGVTFAAPADATGVKICYDGTDAAPTTNWTMVVKNTTGRDDFDNDGVHLYIAVTNTDATVGTAAPTGTGKALDGINPTYANRDKYVWLQFTKADGSNLGAPVLCTIDLTWTNL